MSFKNIAISRYEVFYHVKDFGDMIYGTPLLSTNIIHHTQFVVFIVIAVSVAFCISHNSVLNVIFVNGNYEVKYSLTTYVLFTQK